VLFGGGPPPSYRKTAFLVNLSEADVVQPGLQPALEQRLPFEANRRASTIQGLIDALSEEKVHHQAQVNRHRALFESSEQYRDWVQNQKNHRIEKVDILQCGNRPYFLGIDSGSTTTKVVLIDEKGRVAFSFQQ
jgi:activator of 2-hydroxyglutaryl-CoA dehydratase